jgi:hypothetical protein
VHLDDQLFFLRQYDVGADNKFDEYLLNEQNVPELLIYWHKMPAEQRRVILELVRVMAKVSGQVSHHFDELRAAASSE